MKCEMKQEINQGWDPSYKLLVSPMKFHIAVTMANSKRRTTWLPWFMNRLRTKRKSIRFCQIGNQN